MKKEKFNEEANRVEKERLPLLEKWKEVIEDDKYTEIESPSRKLMTAVMLENQNKYVTGEMSKIKTADINESDATGLNKTDQTQAFLKMLSPLVRRSYGNADVFNLVGNQPISAPSGFYYAMRFMHGGNRKLAAKIPTNLDRGLDGKVNHMSYALVIEQDGVLTDGVFDAIQVGTYVSVDGGVTNTGQIVYKEVDKRGSKTYLKFLVNKTEASSVQITVGDTISISDLNILATPNWGVSGDHTWTTSTNTVLQVNHNEIGFKFIFKNYTGPVDTATGEMMGSTDAKPSYKNIKLVMERKSVQVETRKLEVSFSQELYQDLQNVHGINAEDELINIGEYEVRNELGTHILGRIHELATLAEAWVYGQVGPNTSAGESDGRYYKEKLQTFRTKVNKEAIAIGLATRRGIGNKLVVTTGVLNMLKDLGMTPILTDGTIQSSLSFVGMWDQKEVYLDTYAMGQEYCLVGYKGQSELDAGIIHSTYIPLELIKVTDPDTYHTKYGFITRDAISEQVWGAENYYRYIPIDLTNSPLI